MRRVLFGFGCSAFSNELRGLAARAFALVDVAAPLASTLCRRASIRFTTLVGLGRSGRSIGGTASATAQAGGVVSPSNPISPGQSFSVVSGSGFGPLTVANGSMGAGYGGAIDLLITYKESVSFTQNGGAFVLDLLSNDALGKGFESALFTISLNNAVINSQSFTDLASAEAFFSNNLIGVPLLAGFNSVQIGFSEAMRSAGGSVSTTLSRVAA